MKKVIAGLAAMVIFVVGTAVGVAVSASHLREKELLSAGDVGLALASQGLFAWPVPGNYSDLSAGGVTPVVYRDNGVELLVYEFEDVMARESVSIPYAWASDDELWIGYLGSWRNLYMGTVATEGQLLAWQQDREENYAQQQSDRLN